MDPMSPDSTQSQATHIRLPIAGDDAYNGSADAWIRAVKRVEVILARTACGETHLAGATAYTHPKRHLIPAVNFATDARLNPGQSADSLFDEISSCFADANAKCLAIQCVEASWPKDLATAAEEHGFVPRKMTILRLSHATTSPDPSHNIQIIPARAIYPQTEHWAQACAAQVRPGDDAYATQQGQTLVDFLDEPRFELFLGRVDGRVVASAGVVTLGQTGVFFGVAVDRTAAPPDAGTCLLQHTIDLCRRCQFEDVLIAVPPDDPMLSLNRSAGFEPVTKYVKYVKDSD